nr:MAG TPA: hypothetical protein [Caudoviricetes sp.]
MTPSSPPANRPGTAGSAHLKNACKILIIKVINLLINLRVPNNDVMFVMQ